MTDKASYRTSYSFVRALITSISAAGLLVRDRKTDDNSLKHLIFQDGIVLQVAVQVRPQLQSI